MKPAKTGRRVCATAALLLVPALLLAGCSFSQPEQPDNRSENSEVAPPVDINDATITDKTALYENDQDDSVVTMYLTVRRGNDTDNTNHSWDEVNSHSIYYYDELGIDRNKVEGVLQVGDASGPLAGEFGYGVSVPNTTVQVRGRTSSRAEQKSFKIRIKDEKGDWRGQRTIALNKHAYDSVRFRNKMSYDLIKTVPGMIGARTQFVHLYVKDQTEDGSAGAQFIDYGLYTQVEQINGRYLKNRGLDENGQLYKANMFEFRRYEDALKTTDDPDFDQKAFEEVMEVKGNDDHTKLIAMLADLNNYSIPIEDIFTKYFNEENYFTWLAFQMLSGNKDISSQNFYLYSPQVSNKWYFISWDNDDAWGHGEDMLFKGVSGYNYDQGVTNFWGSILHQRMLKSNTLRQKFAQKVEQVRSLLTPERLTGLANKYSAVAKPYLYAMPDSMHTVFDQADYLQIVGEIPKEVEYNYQMYLTSLERPMPFFLDTPSIVGDQIRFVWDTAYDLDDEAVTYTIEVARDYDFTQLLYKQEGLQVPQAQMPLLGTGQYFFRVVATNASGQTQTAMENYDGEDDVRRYGLRLFYIQPDGTLEEG